MRRVVLKGRGDLDEWRNAARALACAGIAPEDIEWREEGGEKQLFWERDVLPPQPVSGGRSMTVPPAFIDLASAVICHSDPVRFFLLYRLLWRLQSDKSLLSVASDEDVSVARLMEKSVRRDAHKMTAFLRFKEVGSGISVNGRRKFLAWFEPDHHIVTRKAPFFQRRFNDMDWMILTPKGSASWDGVRLSLSDEPCTKPDLIDPADELWKTYFANIFNPARLKVKAMQAEMPKKYWKNMPEAELIPDLIANAEQRVLAMARREATMPPAFHDKLQAASRNLPTAPSAAEGTWEALREQAAACSRCPLHAKATQAVFGEGPQDAEIMFVGEQPGDQEDLAGRPFVGPAGRVFDEALLAAGMNRAELYVTNAVKHFKYEPRGKRRIHQKPNRGEVEHCRWWLERELELVKPKLVVAMGATALFALTGWQQKLEDARGEFIPLEGGRQLFVTVHPSFLLRFPDEGLRQQEVERFRSDIARIGSELASSS